MKRMNSIRSTLWVCLFLFALATAAFAQKVKVGYDKSVDFSKYKTYTWAEPAMPSSRPMLYAMVVDSVDGELKDRGLQKTDKNGDLILIGAGGIEFGINAAAGTPVLNTYGGQPPSLNATMWTGAGGTSNLGASYVPEGALQLQFVDRRANKVVWNGTVSAKLDIENKKKSLDRIYKGIAKLLKQFPPKGASPK
jgi:NADPH:quinone reductase-like Zn-dependent oxidoreductase